MLFFLTSMELKHPLYSLSETVVIRLAFIKTPLIYFESGKQNGRARDGISYLLITLFIQTSSPLLCSIHPLPATPPVPGARPLARVVNNKRPVPR